MTSGNHKNKFWNKFHRWAGLLIAVFILVFCVSGIILNHRDIVSGAEVSRKFMPTSYRIKNYNNGVIKGTLQIGNDSILAFGNCGIWLTDSNFKNISDFNRGFKAGVDNRNIRNIVRTKTGDIWCAAQYGLYKLSENGWKEVELPGNKERLADVCLDKDSCGVVAVTRSNLYISDGKSNFRAITLKTPENHDNGISLFKTIWQLHSGELFGVTGKTIVDIVAVILIFLSITGIILFILPYDMRKHARKRLSAVADRKIFKWNFKWHDKLGYYTFPFVLLIIITGTCLRPPLMIPFVLTKTAPLPGSNLDNDSCWHDKLRALRYDSDSRMWLMSTSDGFYRYENLTDIPVAIPKNVAPPVSPMGITVFRKDDAGKWIVGSFSGLYKWDPAKGIVEDYFTGKSIDKQDRHSFGIGKNTISGYSSDTPRPVVFDYAKGADRHLPPNDLIESQPMSLWNFALELHVGRCYTPFLGPVSDLFVFIFGTLITLILISGFIVSTRHKKR